MPFKVLIPASFCVFLLLLSVVLCGSPVLRDVSGPFLFAAVEKSVSGTRPWSSSRFLQERVCGLQRAAGSEGATCGSPPASRAQAPSVDRPLSVRGRLLDGQVLTTALQHVWSRLLPPPSPTPGPVSSTWVQKSPQKRQLQFEFPQCLCTFPLFSSRFGVPHAPGDCQLLPPPFSHSGKQFVPQEDLEQNTKPFCFTKIRKKTRTRVADVGLPSEAAAAGAPLDDWL